MLIKKGFSKNTDMTVMERRGLMRAVLDLDMGMGNGKKKIKRAWVGDEAVCPQQLRRFRTWTNANLTPPQDGWKMRQFANNSFVDTEHERMPTSHSSTRWAEDEAVLGRSRRWAMVSRIFWRTEIIDSRHAPRKGVCESLSL